MKKILYILTALAIGLASASCTREEADLFEGSAAERLNASVAKYKELLKGSKDGWIMQFYPSSTEMGGVIYSAKFAADSVVMSTEVEFYANGEVSTPAGTTVCSKYRVISEQSVLLTFDTYNPLFHFFSEPQGSSNTEGYASDYEFVFHRVSENQDTIVLKGKKYENVLKMVRLDKEAKEYINTTRANDDLVSFPRYSITIDGTVYPVEMDGYLGVRQFTYWPTDSTEVTVAFIPTESGIDFYEPVELGGVKFSSLFLNRSTGELKSADGRVVVGFPSHTEQLSNPSGMFVFDDGCEEFLNLHSAIMAPNVYSTFMHIFLGMNEKYPATDPNKYILGAYFEFNLFNILVMSYIPGYMVDIMVEGETLDFTSLGRSSGSTGSYGSSAVFSALGFIYQNKPYKVKADSDDLLLRSATLTSTVDPDVWFHVTLN